MDKQQVEAALRFLHAAAQIIIDPELQRVTISVLDDERFQKCTAAREKHQAYEGGLVIHTAEVMDVAVRASQAKGVDANPDILIAAVIWHDYGKIYDYQPAAETDDKNAPKYEYTSHQKLIRHLPRSYAMFMHATEGIVKDEIREQIAHCILAHHGRKEWGSPVEPKTTEAHLLHFADMISAHCTKDTYTR